jgi:hypothetical protein
MLGAVREEGGAVDIYSVYESIYRVSESIYPARERKY